MNDSEDREQLQEFTKETFGLRSNICFKLAQIHSPDRDATSEEQLKELILEKLKEKELNFTTSEFEGPVILVTIDGGLDPEDILKLINLQSLDEVVEGMVANNVIWTITIHKWVEWGHHNKYWEEEKARFHCKDDGTLFRSY